MPQGCRVDEVVPVDNCAKANGLAEMSEVRIQNTSFQLALWPDLISHLVQMRVSCGGLGKQVRLGVWRDSFCRHLGRSKAPASAAIRCAMAINAVQASLCAFSPWSFLQHPQMKCDLVLRKRPENTV